ncbi:MAG: hypothetical protein ABL977_15830 [Candidatus Eisenbacteria bacterium]
MRLLKQLYWLPSALVLGALASALWVSDHRLELRRTPGPLHLAQVWWSPEAASHGAHTLYGRVVNHTDSTWENVQVSLDFQNPNGESLFVRTVVLGRVRPGEPTVFTTGPLPTRAYHIELLAITGTLPAPWPIDLDTPLDGTARGPGSRGHRRSRTRGRPGRHTRLALASKAARVASSSRPQRGEPTSPATSKR